MKTLFLVIALAAHAEAPKAGLASVAAAHAAVAPTQVIAKVPAVQAVVTTDARLYGAQTFPATTSERVNDLPLAVSANVCSVPYLLKSRFLSGPWSATRRLEAARLRGDVEEARRMEVMIDGFIDEAMTQDGL